MYAKAQVQNQSGSCGIPVETYENRDIISALARKNAETQINNARCHSENTSHREIKEHSQHIPHNAQPAAVQNKSCEKHKINAFENIQLEDLLLIGIILLLLFDGNDNNDFLIPLLIALILFS